MRKVVFVSVYHGKNLAFIHRIKLHLKIHSIREQLFKTVIIFHNFYSIFGQINAGLVSGITIKEKKLLLL